MATERDMSNINNDPAALALINAQLREENRLLRRQVEILTQQMAAMQRALYGRSSEKVSADQLQLFIDDVRPDSDPADADPQDETPDYEEAPAPKKKRGPHPGRAPLPQHLERVEIHLHPDSLDCPCCGSEMVPAGEEISEELGMVPASFFVRRRIRHKYACRCCEDAVVRPPLPPVAIEKCQAGSDVLAAIIVSKYADHLPLYRQQAIYRREDVELSRVTMSHWIGQCAFLLQPIVAQMRNELLESGVVQSDDTTIKYLEPPGPAKNGYLWAYVGADQTVVYDFTSGRSREGPGAFLAGFRGILQVDGYAAYNGVFEATGAGHAACWAHVRRKFEKALETEPQEAAEIMQQIQTLYRVEQQICDRSEPLSAEEIVAIRERDALPVIEALKPTLIQHRERALPKSRLATAIEYAFGQWPYLETYIHDGRVAIDNNSCERAMRKVAIGRKNWLFTGSVEGGSYAATLYSLIETCARLKINPHQYLTDVLVRVGSHPQSRIAELTPRAWAAARAGLNT
jgi:transposase